jgi:hypothetical protein
VPRGWIILGAALAGWLLVIVVALVVLRLVNGPG